MAPRFTAAASTVVLAAAAGLASARDVPQNVRDFYDAVVGRGQCDNVLASGFHSVYGGGGGFDYCADESSDVLYIQGKSGALSNMDICCDGIQGGPADDGRCDNDPSNLSITAFQYLVEGYGTGQKDLDANAHPYVVLGNTGDTPGWPTFDPRDRGVEPLSLVAVVCGDQLFYGVWGDMNGDDGDFPMVGEASIALATACYGKGMTGDSGHDDNDVLYIAFPGADAVPGADGAAWSAQNFDDFEASISALGDKLVQRLGGNGGGGETPPTDPPQDDCSWEGHCEGASCSSWDDCADELTCTDGKCAAA